MRCTTTAGCGAYGPLEPGLQAISSYRRAWLGKDIVAGVVLTTLLVPQGMAYAEFRAETGAEWMPAGTSQPGDVPAPPLIG